MKGLHTSDWHFGHVNILKYCPQRRVYLSLSEDPTVEEMNEALVDLWNSQVKPGDTVYFYGDACMGKVDQTIEYIGRLNGTKHLILGNHDKPHPAITKDPVKNDRWTERYLEFFASTCVDGADRYDGIYCRFSHFPYGGLDHTEGERYNADSLSPFYPVDNGRPLVHGHVHDKWQTNGRMFNVGIDAWAGKMVTEQQIGDYFRSIGHTA